MYFGFGIENVYFGTTFVVCTGKNSENIYQALYSVVLLGEYKIYFSFSVVRREVEGRFVTLHLDSLLQKSIPFPDIMTADRLAQSPGKFSDRLAHSGALLLFYQNINC